MAQAGFDNACDTPPKYEQFSQPAVVNQQPMAAIPNPYAGMYNAGYHQPMNSGGTQVTVNVHAQAQQQENTARSWSTSICGCFEDITSCCCVMWFCPCYTCCNLSPRLGESCCAPICLSGFGHSVAMVYRTKVRAAHGIMGGAIDDCTNVLCCTPCVLCQIKRELDFIERTTGKPAFR